MSDFVLDKKLAEDTFELGCLNGQLLLLMNNALVPWFILVPITSKTEICELDERDQTILYRNINLLSQHVLQQFDVSKINVGAIGNVVKQLHVHIIGRNENDYAWPDVVWGRQEREHYDEDQVNEIIENLVRGRGNDFVAGN